MFEPLENRRMMSAAMRWGAVMPEPGNNALQVRRQIGPPAPATARQVAVASTTISDAEKQDLLTMVREEKLARDIYSAMFTKWGSRIFKNISASEQRHFDAVSSLLTRYQIANPVAALPAGKFDDPAVQALYGKLIAEGNASLKSAMNVGVQIEKLDIADLQSAIARTTAADIKTVYSNLLNGSQNHLAAYTRQLDRLAALN